MLTLDLKRFSKVISTVTLSIVFHLWVLSRAVDYAIPTHQAVEQAITEPFEIVELPKTVQPTRRSERERSVVQTEDAGNREEDKNAKFLSDRTQKAEVQERAERIGEFKSKTGSGVGESALVSGSTLPPDIIESEGESVLTPKQLERLSLKDLSVNPGDVASNDSVDKDVASGKRTVLSTREFRYFSYYQRIRDLLRQHWGPNIQQKLARLWQMGKIVEADEWTTQLHILLDKTGKVQKIAKISGCGVADIDTAAVEAFERAGPFPNPPRGLLDDDGFVRINWSFVLTTEAAPRVQFSTPGYGPR